MIVEHDHYTIIRVVSYDGTVRFDVRDFSGEFVDTFPTKAQAIAAWGTKYELEHAA